MQRLMNKVSRVTMWVEPNQKQIVKYTFENVSLDFLPASWLVRVTELRANMLMTEAFPGRVAAEADRCAGIVRARARSVLGELRHPVLRLPRGRDLGQISRTGKSPALTCAEPPALIAAVPLLTSVAASQPRQEIVAAIQVHGNTLTPSRRDHSRFRYRRRRSPCPTHSCLMPKRACARQSSSTRWKC